MYSSLSSSVKVTLSAVSLNHFLPTYPATTSPPVPLPGSTHPSLSSVLGRVSTYAPTSPSPVVVSIVRLSLSLYLSFPLWFYPRSPVSIFVFTVSRSVSCPFPWPYGHVLSRLSLWGSPSLPSLGLYLRVRRLCLPILPWVSRRLLFVFLPLLCLLHLSLLSPPVCLSVVASFQGSGLGKVQEIFSPSLGDCSEGVNCSPRE